MTDEPFLTVEQVAKLLNIRYETALKLVKNGNIKAHLISGSIYRINPEDFQEYLDRTQVVKTGEA